MCKTTPRAHQDSRHALCSCHSQRQATGEKPCAEDCGMQENIKDVRLVLYQQHQTIAGSEYESGLTTMLALCSPSLVYSSMVFFSETLNPSVCEGASSSSAWLAILTRYSLLIDVVGWKQRGENSEHRWWGNIPGPIPRTLRISPSGTEHGVHYYRGQGRVSRNPQKIGIVCS